MDLSKLLKNLPQYTIYFNNLPIKSTPKINILGICSNSKKALKNNLFIALNGTKLNGNNFIFDAIKNGATAIVCENNFIAPKNVCVIKVKNARIALSILAENFFNNAHKKLKIIGITGTNGKSSCAYILHQVLMHKSKLNPNFKCGLIGTNAVLIGNTKIPPTLTTPDPITLNEIFYKMVKAKCKICIMEISAHAIYFNKIYGINFEVLALTNVKTDHLDFFKTQTNYINQKIKLFTDFKSKHIVLNYNDKIGRFLFNKLNKPNKTSLFFEQKKNIKFAKNCSNFCGFKLLKSGLNKTEFMFNFNKQRCISYTNLMGKIYLKNISLCMCVLTHLKLEINEILTYFKYIFIEGRLNVYKFNSNINFILDYAHTFSSTKEVLNTIKKVSNFKNIIILGAPGNRDEFKRKKTSRLCKKYGKVFLTSDNPKFENPYKIMEEMKKGNKNALLLENREKVIKLAHSIALSSKNNYNIIILGKGIENYQDYNNKQIFYSDKLVLDEIFSKK